MTKIIVDRTQVTINKHGIDMAQYVNVTYIYTKIFMHPWMTKFGTGHGRIHLSLLYHGSDLYIMAVTLNLVLLRECHFKTRSPKSYRIDDLFPNIFIKITRHVRIFIFQNYIMAVTLNLVHVSGCYLKTRSSKSYRIVYWTRPSKYFFYKNLTLTFEQLSSKEQTGKTRTVGSTYKIYIYIHMNPSGKTNWYVMINYFFTQHRSIPLHAAIFIILYV